MAPVPVSLEVQEIGPLGPGIEYNFPSRPGMPLVRPRPSTGAGAPDVDDVFVVAVSLLVVASLTAFVLYQAIGALKEMMDTRPSPFSSLSIASFRKHGWNSLNSTKDEQLPLVCPSNVSIDSTGCRRNSRWVGPEHRCQFTLSPDPYDSDTSSTLTRSSSDSTVVGGRICVVYDDTIESREPSDEEDSGEGEESDSDGEEEEDVKVPEEKPQYRPPMYEPRTRVRRQAIFST